MANTATTGAVVGLAYETWSKGAKRRTRRLVWRFVTGCSWDGDRVKSVTTTDDRTKAFVFRPETAYNVARCYRSTAAVLEAK